MEEDKLRVRDAARLGAVIKKGVEDNEILRIENMSADEFIEALPPYMKKMYNAKNKRERLEQALKISGELQKYLSVEDYADNVRTILSMLAENPVMDQIGKNPDRFARLVKFSMLKGMMSRVNAYKIAFPERYQGYFERHTDKTATEVKDVIDKAAAVLEGTPLARAIDELVATPFLIANAPLKQRALLKLVDLMEGKAAPKPNGQEQAVSPHVQFLAAKEIVDVLTPKEETTQINITNNISTGKDTSILAALKDELEDLATKEYQAIVNKKTDLSTIGKLGLQQKHEDIIDVQA